MMCECCKDGCDIKIKKTADGIQVNITGVDADKCLEQIKQCCCSDDSDCCK